MWADHFRASCVGCQETWSGVSIADLHQLYNFLTVSTAIYEFRQWTMSSHFVHRANSALSDNTDSATVLVELAALMRTRVPSHLELTAIERLPFDAFKIECGREISLNGSCRTTGGGK
jgi:hypothetical protein